MYNKIICFDCKSHSVYDKNDNCYRCGSNMIVRTGPALRLPRKNNNNAWKDLREIYLKQYKSSMVANMNYMRGFANNSLLHDCQYRYGLTKKDKEKATILALKK